MKWEKGPRVVPGYYWLCRKYPEYGDEPYMLLVEVAIGPDGGHTFFPGDDEEDGSGRADDWFMGPLELPTPPEVGR